MLKKKGTAIAALVMTAVMSTAVLAADGGSAAGVTNQAEIPVKGIVTDYVGAETVISMDVIWDAMSFTYVKEAQGKWNASSHQYEEAASLEGWSKDTKTITVVNHSNAEMKAQLTFQKDTGITGDLTGSFAETSGTVNDGVLEFESADEGDSLNDYEKAPKASAEFGITGDAIAADQALGTITVKLNAVKVEVPTVSSISVDKGFTDGYGYNYHTPHAPDWSALKLEVLYSDGSSQNIDGATEGVVLSPNGKTLEQLAEENASYTHTTYTVTYQGKSCEVSIYVRDFDISGGGLPSGVYREL